jgi:hypothetical protein
MADMTHSSTNSSKLRAAFALRLGAIAAVVSRIVIGRRREQKLPITRICAIGLTVLVVMAKSEGHAQTQDGIPPPQLPDGPQLATPQFISPPFGGTWQVTALAPAGVLNNPLLLTDGTVLIFSEVVQQGAPSTAYKLTPDANGSYVNGTWSQIASLPTGYQPFAFASAVLPDGRVIVEGGECNSAVIACTTDSVWSSLGAIL